MKSRSFLEQFPREWKYHHPVSDQQVNSAGILDTVKGAAFYHGAAVLYTLSNTPGTWDEECLEWIQEEH